MPDEIELFPTPVEVKEESPSEQMRRLHQSDIPPDTIKGRHLEDGSIGEDKLADASVTEDKIEDASVSSDKLQQPLALVSPNITGTVAGSAIYTKPTLNGSVQALTTDTDGSTITFNLAASNIHSVTLTDNRTLAISNGSVGQVFVIRLIQDGTGSRTVTWFSTIKWADSVAPTLTTTVNKIDSFGFIITSSGNYDGYIIGQNIG